MSDWPNEIEKRNLFALLLSPTEKTQRLGAELAKRWPAFLRSEEFVTSFGDALPGSVGRELPSILLEFAALNNHIQQRVATIMKIARIILRDRWDSKPEVDRLKEALASYYSDYKPSPAPIPLPFLPIDEVEELYINFDYKPRTYQSGELVFDLEKEILDFNNLKRLWLEGPTILCVPYIIPQLSKVEFLGLHNTGIREFSSKLSEMPQLREFHLTSNTMYMEKPPALNEIPLLHTLDLSGTKRIQSWDFISDCKELHKLSLRNTRMNTVPAWLLDIPKLESLDLRENRIVLRNADKKRITILRERIGDTLLLDQDIAVPYHLP